MCDEISQRIVVHVSGLAPSIRNSPTEMCGRRFTPINRPVGVRAPA